MAKEYKVGDWVEWVHYTRGGMTRTGGPIHEIIEGEVRVRRGKNGKKDYWMPISKNWQIFLVKLQQVQEAQIHF